MRAIIFDIDGTVADVSHRVHHLDSDPKDWSSFFGAMHIDPVIEPVAWLAKMLMLAQKLASTGEEYAVLVVSARPDDENYKQVTIDWLAANGISYDRLYMRTGGDFRADQIVKAEILQQICDDGYEPFLVIDDRPQVVEMWRSYGITCLQCAPDEPRQGRHAGQVMLHMLVGPAGSGKSTYCAKHYKPNDVVSSDEVRRQLFGDHEGGHTREELARTWKYIHGLIKVRMENGIFTVLDATNLKPKDRLSVLKQVPQGVLVQYVVIDRDYDAKIKDRGWRSEELIDKHHRQMKSNLKGILNADNLGNVIVVDKR